MDVQLLRVIMKPARFRRVKLCSKRITLFYVDHIIMVVQTIMERMTRMEVTLVGGTATLGVVFLQFVKGRVSL